MVAGFQQRAEEMLKKVLILILLSAATVTAEAGSWHRKLAPAQAEAKKTGQLILVDMFAEWCGWCHRMEREVFPSEAFQNASRDLVLLRLDTEDRGEGMRYAREWGVSSLPTFVLVTADLEVTGLIRGYAPAGPFSQKLTGLLDAHRRFESIRAKGDKATPAERIELAGTLIERGRMVDAESTLTKLLGSSGVSAPVAAKARYQLALAQFEQGKHDESLKTVNTVLSARPAPDLAEQASFLRARIYVEQSNFPAARDELKAFRSKYPKSEMIATVNRVLPQIERAIASQ